MVSLKSVLRSPKVPVALFVHARPAETGQVLESIRGYAPERLYVVADGYRLDIPGERARCIETRNLFRSLDWPCELKVLERNMNLGSGKSVSNGLDWLFSMEDMAIILEDDTVPHASFFLFCEQLLNVHKNDSRVGIISASNLVQYPASAGADYFFSRIPATWGWATWRRAWLCNDFDMSWLGPNQDSTIRRISINRKHRYFWKWAIQKIQNKKVDAWDWQWHASLAIGNKLTIVPSVNLVENIGFGQGATHTFREPKGANFRTSALEPPFLPPKEVGSNVRYDQLVLSRLFPDRRPEVLLARLLRDWFFRFLLNPIYLRIRSICEWSRSRRNSSR